MNWSQKECPHCHETIGRTASICPKCNQSCVRGHAARMHDSPPAFTIALEDVAAVQSLGKRIGMDKVVQLVEIIKS